MEILFEVKTSTSKVIRTTQSHWELIAKLKHPEMEGKEAEVKNCLSNPVEIRKSSEAPDVYLYYSPYMQYYICVVAKHLNGDGFIITAYITDKIKEGGTVWKR
ncbi:MAG: DUF4258 domain-containing protein [Nitrospirae bacterium]|nr:DUF4258 domain-containing protein [Nitrospirota bacterium]